MEHIGPEIQRLLNIIDERRAREAERGIKAWLLAPNLTIYRALVAGEQVPVDQLRPDAVQKYGIRKGQAA